MFDKLDRISYLTGKTKSEVIEEAIFMHYNLTKYKY